MDQRSKSMEDLTPDPDFFSNIQCSIEKELGRMKKIVNNINQMRVEAAYLESDLVMVIDAPAWQQISDLIRPGSMHLKVSVKEETID